MARGVNKAILVGNLGSDPETRYTAGGSAVTNVSLATTDSWKDKQSGEQQEKTEWHKVVFFGRLAEIAAEYLRKGSQIYVEGRIQTRKWQGKDGQDRWTTEIVGNEMQMLGGRGGGGRRAGAVDAIERPTAANPADGPRKAPAPRKPRPEKTSTTIFPSESYLNRQGSPGRRPPETAGQPVLFLIPGSWREVFRVRPQNPLCHQGLYLCLIRCSGKHCLFFEYVQQVFRNLEANQFRT